MTENLYEQQRALEEQAINDGITRYRSMLEAQGMDNDKTGRKLLDRNLEALVEAIDDLVRDTVEGKAGRGRPALAIKYLANFDPEVAAYITLRRCISSLTTSAEKEGKVRGEPVFKIALHIGTMMEEHVRFEEFRQTDPGLAHHMEKKLAKRNSGWQRRAVLRHALKLTSVKGLEWSEKDKITVGLKLIDLVITTLGIFTSELTAESKHNRARVLVPTADTQKWIDNLQNYREVSSPMHLPMVIPPRPWVNPKNGGYLNMHLNKTDMVRTQLDEDDLFSIEMPEMYASLNAIQETPWRINTSILNVMKEARVLGTELACLPPADDAEIPEPPVWLTPEINSSQLSGEKLEAFKDWKARAAQTHTDNARLISRRIQFAQQVAIAERFRDYNCIYFPHNLDFRGRVYPIPATLNPQANDPGKALLEFGEGKPLGSSGAWWLAVHISNLFGNDKVSFEDRAQWTVDNEVNILASVADPLGAGDFWLEADKPWCALAACMEWAGYLVDGEEYVSHMPIAMDGSCSGLQHYSAMLRDADGGQAVNLTPSDAPQDIYRTVAELVEEKLLTETDPLLTCWSGKVTRSIVKRPCMTYAYSVTERGIRDQILDEIKKLDNSVAYLGDADRYAASNALSKLVLESISEVVKAAAQGMDFLKESARVVSGENSLPLQWVTPIGLPVVQNRVNSTNKRFNAWFEGRRMRFSLGVPTKKIDLKGQKASVAPNFIHSMDAAHLMLTVNACTDVGIQDFAMIHDSFGTHACYVDEMNHLLRREFISMYSVDRLQELRTGFTEIIGTTEGLPEVPPLGDLDLSLVQQSDFFFS